MNIYFQPFCGHTSPIKEEVVPPLIADIEPQEIQYPLFINKERTSVESLLPSLFPKEGSSIAVDIIKKCILPYLPSSKIAKMMEINCTWHTLIERDKTIYNAILFNSCMIQ